MNIFLVILAIFVLILYGLCFGLVLNLLDKKSIIEKIAYAFGIGSGLMAIEMFLFSIFRIQWNLVLLLLPVFFVSSIGIKKNKKFKGKKLHLPQLSLIQLVFLITISMILIYVLFESVLRPLPSWDGWSAFFLQGKAYFIDGFLNPEVAKYSGVTNPPLVALLITFVYKFIGMADDKNSLLLFTFFYISTSVILFETFRKKINITYALCFTFLFMSAPNVLRHSGNVDLGHADIILGYYFLTSALAIHDFIINGKVKNMILCQLLLAFGALVKDEGLVFFILGELVLLYVIIKNKISIRKEYFGIGIAIVFSWIFFKYINAIPKNPFYEHVPDIYRFKAIMVGIFVEFLNVTRWNVLWPAGMIILFLRRFKGVNLFIVLLSIQLLVYILIYFTTPENPTEHIRSSFDRLLLQILPLFIYAVGLSCSNMTLKE